MIAKEITLMPVQQELLDQLEFSRPPMSQVLRKGTPIFLDEQGRLIWWWHKQLSTRIEGESEVKSPVL